MALLLAALLGSVTLCTADFRASCEALTVARVDPIVTPGKLAHHTHDVVGSLGFADTTNASWNRKNQTSCSIIGDNSNYWAPGIYHQDQVTGVLTHMPFGINAYYTTGRAEPLKHPEIASTFPFNLSMVSHKSVKQYIRNGVFHDFLDELPNDSSCDGIRIDYFFPNCYNGGPYKDDQSHMAYPFRSTTMTLGTCPPTHPHYIFILRVEHQVTIPKEMRAWKGKAPFTLSSGGFDTAHADATLFWDRKVMQNLVDQCNKIIPDSCDGKIKTQASLYRPRAVREANAAAYDGRLPPRYQIAPAPWTVPEF